MPEVVLRVVVGYRQGGCTELVRTEQWDKAPPYHIITHLAGYTDSPRKVARGVYNPIDETMHVDLERYIEASEDRCPARIQQLCDLGWSVRECTDA